MSTKNYGHLIMPTPIVNSSGGDFSLVADTDQANYPLGGVYIYPDSSSRPRIVKYVRYDPTTAATWTQGAPLYYKDHTRTVVTNVVAEAETYLVTSCSSLNSFAGIGMNASDPTDGKYIFIQTGGFSDKINMPASTAVGDILILSNAAATAPTDNTFVRVAADSDVTLLRAIAAIVYLTDIVVGGGAGLGGGWIQTPCSPV